MEEEDLALLQSNATFAGTDMSDELNHMILMADLVAASKVNWFHMRFQARLHYYKQLDKMPGKSHYRIPYSSMTRYQIMGGSDQGGLLC